MSFSPASSLALQEEAPDAAVRATAVRVGWHAKSFDPRKASIRLRVDEPMSYLREQGFDAGAYCSREGVGAYNMLIFSKSFSDEALSIAREARALGRPIVFDICDNMFGGKLRLDRRSRHARLRDMMRLATHVTFSTPVLAGQVIDLMPEIEAKSRVIPDALEEPKPNCGKMASAKERAELDDLRRFLNGHRGALHCVWFGKSQGNLSGFAHLHRAVDELERFAKTHPVTLTIISNDRVRYWAASLRWKLPTHYVPWSLESFGEALRLHDVAIIPVERNRYTVGKTINRPATAIAAGLGVIADSIGSYEELRPFIPLDDWQGGLRQYLEQPPAVDERLEQAREHLRQRYGRCAVGALWQQLLAEITA